MTAAAGAGHPTSCMSCAEALAVLLFDLAAVVIQATKGNETNQNKAAEQGAVHK